VAVWDDRELDGIGIPGRITRAQIAYSIHGKASDNNSNLNSDYKDYTLFFGIEPFALVKNKWLSGLRLELGSWWCHTDGRPQAQKTCNEITLEEGENAGPQTLMEIASDVRPGKATGKTHWLHGGIHGGSDPHTLHLWYYAL
jgi:hypothetical protein